MFAQRRFKLAAPSVIVLIPMYHKMALNFSIQHFFALVLACGLSHLLLTDYLAMYTTNLRFWYVLWIYQQPLSECIMCLVSMHNTAQHNFINLPKWKTKWNINSNICYRVLDYLKLLKITPTLTRTQPPFRHELSKRDFLSRPDDDCC